MVVTRRAPVTPAPNSRTSSAQALPRVAKGKSTFDVAGNPVVDIEPKPVGHTLFIMVCHSFLTGAG